MKLTAQVQVTFTVPFEADVPDLEHEPVENSARTPGRAPGLEAKNEKAVLAARRRAAKQAEKLARDAVKGLDVAELTVTEVREA